jgi:phosphodiesterase/alkaline phosphatase D-like protein
MFKFEFPGHADRADQDEVLGYLESAKIQNTVVLTGDFHAHWAFDLPRYPCKAQPEYSGYNETGGHCRAAGPLRDAAR